MSQESTVTIEVAPGELIDKITILEIKSQHIADAAKLKNIHTELSTLIAARDKAIPASQQLTELTLKLKEANQRLWHIEDGIRDCERQQRFDAEFVDFARSVYKTNDLRSAIKRQINDLLGSRLVEEKSYAPY